MFRSVFQDCPDATTFDVFFLNVLQAQNYWWDCYVFPIYNPGQDILNKIEKSSKTGQDKKSLISTFACFLTAIDNV